MIQKFLSIYLIGMLFIQSTFAQTNARTDCNTIFICIDSVSYDELFTNRYFKDTLFICKVEKNETNIESYTGKYLIGKSATLEFFKPKNDKNFGNTLGDLGIEFKTRKLGSLDLIFKNATKNNIKTDTLTTLKKDDGKTFAWYKTVAIKKNNLELSVLEYQRECLKHLGFSESEIDSEMTYEAFNSYLSNGKKYPRQFDKIKSISIEINKNQLKALQQFCQLNEMKKRGDSFFNNDFEIAFKTNKTIDKIILKSIDIQLIETQPEKEIQVSQKIKIIVKDKKAQILFLK